MPCCFTTGHPKGILQLIIITLCKRVGKPCSPYETIKVLDESGKAVSKENNGELGVKGPGIFAGYLKNPQENKKSFTPDRFLERGIEP
ncbi:MAG: AMP-binding protein [Deltaproteobacteria bacterium]|nr:AMP-binding protein [Deltaproteobacteria bacterium]